MSEMDPKVSAAMAKWASERFFNFNDIEALEMPEGILRKQVTLGGVMLVWYQLPQGLDTDPTHNHPHEQISYIVSGEVEATIDGKAQVCGPGGGYLVPSGVSHHIKVLADCVCIDAFSPPREDYL
jgi:unsaturated pyranuronate lyase